MYEPSDASFDDTFCDETESGQIGIIVAGVYAEIETIGSVDLYVEESGAVGAVL